MNNKKEMVFALSATLMMMGILGIEHSPLLGILTGNYLLDALYITSGLATFIFAFRKKESFFWFSVVYGVLALVGFFTSHGSMMNLMDVNTADNSFHLFLAVMFLSISIFGEKWFYSGKVA